jgi:hypothetical protein
VGSNLIARTEHAALAMLQALRDQPERPIPLAWGLPMEDVSAIEVYPAAILVAHGFRSSGYKRQGQVNERRELIASLAGLIDVGDYRELL